MKKSIFEFDHYKAFLQEWLKSLPGNGRGKRSELAETMRCKPAYVSQVLNGDAHLSLEQSEVLGRYLGFSREETEFLLLLVQSDRAGSENLRHIFKEQIARERERREVLKDRLGVREGMSELDRARYYSAWYYTAVHMLLTIPQFQSRAEIAKRLQLPSAKVAAIIEFLLEAGLAEQKGDHFQATKTSIHLGSDSPEIIRHHGNWRTRAAIACENETPEALHYSSVVTLARADAQKIRETVIRMIEEVRAQVAPSKEEELFAFCADWFRI